MKKAYQFIVALLILTTVLSPLTSARLYDSGYSLNSFYISDTPVYKGETFELWIKVNTIYGIDIGSSIHSFVLKIGEDDNNGGFSSTWLTETIEWNHPEDGYMSQETNGEDWCGIHVLENAPDYPCKMRIQFKGYDWQDKLVVEDSKTWEVLEKSSSSTTGDGGATNLGSLLPFAIVGIIIIVGIAVIIFGLKKPKKPTSHQQPIYEQQQYPFPPPPTN